MLVTGPGKGLGTGGGGVTYPCKDHCFTNFQTLACVYLIRYNFTNVLEYSISLQRDGFLFPSFACPPAILSSDHGLQSGPATFPGVEGTTGSVEPEAPQLLFNVSLLW